ncbi:MAG: FIG043197: Inositol monophosphatase family protein [uncultured Sphingomonadaceae bacterium]|uniref:FIG043197: Inositol monophosphatase family protein n=1 Tax=uncultured Sphingomonadaceae bacterium TaxID=169976 RepID=A0A6J4TWW1_9SPHN|nr:MAG: FIG043197: Inositol monophosphatase family protein [uncultured Sphingomonadaceae bacterium]
MLDRLTAVVADAGALALSRVGGDYKRWDKSPGHPVSDVDLAVDAFLRERLEGLAPDAAWLSEETADDRARLGRSLVWIVDPIDGTRDYLRQRPGWCVSVALVEDGAPLLGVLCAPARGEIWVAERGRGAACNGAPVAAAERDRIAGARVPIDVLPKADRDLVAVSKPNSIALRIAMVAAGEADLIASTRPGNEWDIAAAALVASEAGAAVSDARGEALRFNTERAEALGVIVCAPGLHRAVVERFGV